MTDLVNAEELMARARKGAVLLDAWAARTGYGLPAGDWASQIDLGRLDLGQDSDCVLGQIFGGYIHGKYELFGDLFDREFDAAIFHGFDLFTDEVSLSVWPMLTAAWLVLIDERTGEISDPRLAQN